MKILVTTFTLAGLGLASLTLTAATRPASPSTSAPAPEAVAYEVDPVHSCVLFSTTHLGVSRSYGRFNKVSGTFSVDAAKPEKSKVSFQVQTDSLDTNSKKRDDHLRGPDFFDVKQFPTAKFESTSVTKAGDKHWKVIGDLTLHGVTKSIPVALEEVGAGKGQDGGTTIGYHGTFTVKRSEFGVSYMPGGLGEEVAVIVSVEAGSK